MIGRKYLAVITIVFGIGLTALIAVHALAVEKSPPDVDTQLKQLQERVAQLEARVQKLEKKPALVTVQATKPSKDVPKDWHLREFNGMKYYIVPLEKGK